MLSPGALYLVVPGCLCLLGLLLSVVLVFMLRTNVCLAINGTYRRLMYVTAAWNILTAITDAITSLAVQNVGHTIVVFGSHRFSFDFFSSFKPFFFLLRITLIVTGLQMTTFHFIYRFLALKGSTILKDYSFIVILTSSSSIMVIAGALLLVLTKQVEPALTNFFVEAFGPGYGIPSLISEDLENSMSTWIGVLAVMLAFLATWLALWHRTRRMLTTGEGLDKQISFRTTLIHKKLLQLVCRMSVIQMIFTVIFFGSVIPAGILGASVPPLLYTIPSFLMSMSPLLTTLGIIFHVDSLRTCFIGYFRCSRVSVVQIYVPPSTISC